MRRTGDPMNHAVYNVLFLCTGNSARSIMAEAILNQLGKPHFRAYSAGSHPAGQVNPLALELLARNQMPTEGVRSKSWDEFAVPGAPMLDFVFTVCDRAAAETCPVRPGQPITAHWGVPDPAEVGGSDDARRAVFKDAFIMLDRRIQLLLALPIEKLDRLKLGNGWPPSAASADSSLSSRSVSEGRRFHRHVTSASRVAGLKWAAYGEGRNPFTAGGSCGQAL